MMKRFSESTFGIIFLSVIPAIVSYIVIAENWFSNINWGKYLPLFYSVGVGTFFFIFFQIRKYIIEVNKKLKEYSEYRKAFDEIKEYRKKIREQTILIMDDQTKLWDNINKLAWQLQRQDELAKNKDASTES